MGVSEQIKKRTPDQKTIPSAMVQGTWFLMTIVYVNSALRPMPGPTAKGNLAYRPIKRVEKKHRRTVAVRTPEKGICVSGVAKIAGLTTTM